MFGLAGVAVAGAMLSVRRRRMLNGYSHSQACIAERRLLMIVLLLLLLLLLLPLPLFILALAIIMGLSSNHSRQSVPRHHHR